ncbi:uncharacterized protein LOC130712436 [Lotus japonicus]|uniref:uncharacterized protein LOC130712436 n=1 Tax=Lotus japonicus TaxID=34305 RepID=UPI002587D495|nr:uncharacterized protein LOC130712436 [Lotus japonicus]
MEALSHGSGSKVIFSLSRKKLDRALGDIDWRVELPDTCLENLSRIHSDHSPLLVHCGERCVGRPSRPFHFIAAWADHPDYQKVVKYAWTSGGEDITTKLGSVRVDSIAFNTYVFGDIYRIKRRVEARI